MLDTVRRMLRPKRLGGFAAAALMAWGWTTNEVHDPLQRISREDLNLRGDVALVVVKETGIVMTFSGPVEGRPVIVETMSFGEDGLLREWVQYAPTEGLALAHRYTTKDGLLFQVESYHPGGGIYEIASYSHSEDGRTTTAKIVTGPRNVRKTVVYTRDADGNLLSVVESNAAKVLVSEVRYTRTGNEERADRYDGEGELLSWSIKRFDADGRVIEASLHTVGGEDEPYTITYEYDDRGNLTLEETSGQLSLGFLVLTLTPSATKTKHEYTYDDEGNWIERVTSAWVSDGEDGEWRETAKTLREIAYYE